MNIIGKTHELVLLILALVLVAFFTTMWVESKQKAEDYINYFAIIPAKAHYDFGSKLDYFAFVNSEKNARLQWEDDLFCNSGSGFVFYDSEINDSDDYEIKIKYPQVIQDLLDGYDLLSISARASADTQLRRYGRKPKTKNDRWTLDVKTPPDGSLCYSRHTITVYTRVFGFERTMTRVTSEWTYGDKNKLNSNMYEFAK